MKIVVIVSGGMDSITLLYKALHDGHDVHPLTFDYGQKHVKEIECSRNILKQLNIEPKVVDLSGIGEILKSSLTSDIEVPEGHYEEENMKSTVVPNRNMIMISIAAGYAESIGAEAIWFGAHGGDHAIYPDCRPEFVNKMSQVLKIAMYNTPILDAPFIGYRKQDIVKLGTILEVPFEKTWSCYNGREKHCGKCGTCSERREAFELAGIADSTEYEEG